MSTSSVAMIPPVIFFFFFNDTATTEIYTLSLHDALPICRRLGDPTRREPAAGRQRPEERRRGRDRKSTRLNSSHSQISYAVFCLKKKTTITLSHAPAPLAPSAQLSDLTLTSDPALGVAHV